MIAAGGTGGHISPALAIGEHLRQVDPACRIEFVCGTRPVEQDVYRKAGIEPTIMEVHQLRKGPIGVFVNIRNMLRSLREARQILSRSRPEVVVGMGGYVCVPIVQAAAGENIPTLIHEQNSVAGRANRWLSRRVRTIACAYAEAARDFPSDKTNVTGNPVRPAFIGGDRNKALERWRLRSDRPTVLVFGGSQGAQRLNGFVLDALPMLDEQSAPLDGIQLLWACGERNYDDLRAKVESTPLERLDLRLLPFIQEMGLAYATADLAVTRAGAMTLAELMANALPAIVVPLPGATAGHQYGNAQPFEAAGALEIVEEGKLDGRILAERITSLLSKPSQLDAMRKAARDAGKPNAVEEIVKIILQLRAEIA
jgi:UDP-N-acetylglucosamine--N-acetylmuramyl-(pentapeptide) pyrophosphoryl-undecaprenol N-acetylglucosamine transferase